MKTFALQWNLMIMKGNSLEDAEWSFSTEKPHFLTTPSINFNVSHSMLNSSGVHFLLSQNSSNDNMSARWNNSTYGDYDRPSIPSFNRMSLIKTILFGIFLLISVVGNTLTLVQVYRMRRRKSTINTLVFLLASADLMVSFFVMVTEMTWTITVQWLAGTFMCKLMKYLEVFGFYLSTYTVVIISLDRCCAILDPLRRNRAPDRVRAMIIVAWILSALFSIPQAIVFTVEKAPFAGIDYYQCVTFTILTQKWQEQLYAILTIITTFILPLLTMIIAYALIFLAITRTSKDFQEESSDVSRGHVRSQLLRKAKTKSLIMTTIIVVAFIVCWSPYYIFWLWHTFNTQSSQDNDSNTVGTWVFFFGMANSMVNPMIYGAFHICRSQRPIVHALLDYVRCRQFSTYSSTHDDAILKGPS
ncbi:gonadotropin-releasing hormone receptor isoform X2 [Lingula anatina]|uniref:Gonadotropin-releasing hormone receptor isoform X2 n=1 Tax=Lingula anatina TaxID=7574 RepID=A0A1S3J7X2_LINAN|nr:gonadotropin-releasing hormone receptor isoform X2 [Lingula anatina]|eukprot:XP_013406331.1 gonadotropin-releasing hormone receptor isoform X2 [Lingula anatina]